MSVCLPVWAGPKATSCWHVVKMPLEQAEGTGGVSGLEVRSWLESCVTLRWPPSLSEPQSPVPTREARPPWQSCGRKWKSLAQHTISAQQGLMGSELKPPVGRNGEVSAGSR